MDDEVDSRLAYRPIILDAAAPADSAALARLREDTQIEVVDMRAAIRAEFDRLVDPPFAPEGPESQRWVYYPWRRTIVGLPGERTYRAVRLDRNRNKLTRAEQDQLRNVVVGVVGLSVGHAIAYTLALEGVCGRIRLADPDDIELSNLNRVPATVFDLAVNKAVVAARRIAELDPYLPVEVLQTGVDSQSLDAFLDGLSIVIEECDSFDIKLAIREGARRRRLPLIMETSDRGLLDVERYDLDCGRQPFHGLLGAVDAAKLRGLSTGEQAPYVLEILQGDQLSARGAASIVEVGEKLSSWPQLGGEVMLGGATVAATVRRIGLGVKVPSGRTRVDVEAHLDALAEPAPPRELIWDDDDDDSSGGDPLGAVLDCAQRAPSGGNSQPWSLVKRGDTICIELVPERSSAMDFCYRASAVSVGAALYNARVAAASHGLLGEYRFIEDDTVPLCAELRLGNGADPALAAEYPAVLARETNRNHGNGATIPKTVVAALTAAAEAEGARLRLVTRRSDIETAADLLGESERIRFLTPQLHEQMLAELRWPEDDPHVGIDVRSLELSPSELTAFELGSRADVMAQLRSWSGGAALGRYLRDRVRSSSAVAVVTFVDPSVSRSASLSAYARSGAAVERVWAAAQRFGLAVQPVSPVFLYTLCPEELNEISPEFADTLASLRGRFLDLLEVPVEETMALVLRLSYATGASVRSRRIPVPGTRPRS
ncbi:Rv1355c family protein [Nocardia transvalensis]|uniref:Rv1355c family protein n=1 Tax=Nocardia transvalensis TaxID=37333 RepID=UPI001895F024|nr:Rv1355c family protein [Nocardia transvalensis]MBF6330651.1 Rv1355c family protein [Nocardia transvalensis]